MPPVQVIATIKTINGKPADPGANPVVDMTLRTEATPELLKLFGGIGQEFDITFVRRGGDQISMFDDDEDDTPAEVYDFVTPEDGDSNGLTDKEALASTF